MNIVESGKIYSGSISGEVKIKPGDIYMYEGNVPPIAAHAHKAERAVLERGEWSFLCCCGTPVSVLQARVDFEALAAKYLAMANSFEGAYQIAQDSSA